MNDDANDATPGLPVPGRILFDLTTSLGWRDRHAVGIVRTERELARHLMAMPEVCFIPVASHADGIRALDPDAVLELLNPATMQAAAHPTPDLIAPLPPVAGRGWLALLAWPFALTARCIVRGLLKLLPLHVRHDASQCLVMARQVVRGLLYRLHVQSGPMPETAASAPPVQQTELPLIVHPAATDIPFLAGLHWDVVNWQRIARLRARTGLRVVSVMYDLIPIKFPEFIGSQQNDYYLNCFLHLIDKQRFDILYLAENASRSHRVHRRAWPSAHANRGIVSRLRPPRIT